MSKCVFPIQGVTKQSNEVMSNEVTRYRVTGKKNERVKKC